MSALGRHAPGRARQLARAVQLLVWAAGALACSDPARGRTEPGDRAGEGGLSSASAVDAITSSATTTGAPRVTSGALQLATSPRAACDSDRFQGTSECTDCLCARNPTATMACGGDCWRLLYCVAASGCAPTDVVCVRHECTVELGGPDAYLEAAMQLVRTPFVACKLECLADVLENDGGDTQGSEP